MNIRKIISIDDLKALGKFREVREELFKVVKFLQEKWIDAVPGPFVSRQAEIIFCLTQMEGRKRNELLGLTDEHYQDAVLAKQWYRSLRQFVHSDRKGGSDAAFIALDRLYKIVTCPDDEDE